MPEDVLETTELTLLRALTEAGGQAERHELEAPCLAAGMKLSSFNNRVAYSPIVTDLGHGRYGLRGADGDGADGRTAVWRPAGFGAPRRRGAAARRPRDLPPAAPPLGAAPCWPGASPPSPALRSSSPCSSGCTASR